MELKLTAPDDELISKFLTLKKPNDVADLLEVDYKYLAHRLFRVNLNSQYKIFGIITKIGVQK